MLRAIQRLARFLAYSLRKMGPRRLVAGSLRLLADPEARRSDHDFDTRFGTDTTSGVTPAEAAIPRARRRQVTMYLPTLERDFDAMLGALEWSPDLLQRATFVDLGSGKGRVVFLAAMRRFRAVVGVELSPLLHGMAAQNLVTMKRACALRSPVRLVCGDAAEVVVPAGPLVVFLYHPFDARIAEAVIARLLESLAHDPRPIAILYGHPTLQRPLSSEVFDRGGVFSEAAHGARATRRFEIAWSIWTNESRRSLEAVA